MRHVAEYYGFPVSRKGICRCPFHDDEHPSMKIYDDDKGYYCFSCGEGGDVIKFVSRLYGLRNEEACRKLIADFALPIKTGGFSYREIREREKKVQERKRLGTFVKSAKETLGMYRQLLCDAAREPDNQHFAEALQELSKTEYRLDCLDQYPREFYADRKAVEWLGAVRERIAGWHR